MNLKVEVLKKFKKDIFARFDYENFKKCNYSAFYVNYFECVLCAEYYRCRKCPFKKFSTKTDSGCIVWIKKGVPDFFNEIIFNHYCCRYTHGNKAIKLLKQFTKKLEKYIEWI